MVKCGVRSESSVFLPPSFWCAHLKRRQKCCYWPRNARAASRWAQAAWPTFVSLASQQLWRIRGWLSAPCFQPGTSVLLLPLQPASPRALVCQWFINVCKCFLRAEWRCFRREARLPVGQQQLKYLSAAVIFDGACTLLQESCQMAFYSYLRALCN